MKLLLLFQHGLGDCLQFTIVLKHLRHYYPQIEIGVVAGLGRDNVFYGLADKHWPLCHPFTWRDETWDSTLDVEWRRPTFNYLAAPTTKVSESLITEFGLQPIPELFKYEMIEQPGAREQARPFLDSLPKPFAIIHGYSEVSNEQKNLTEQEALAIANGLLDQGTTPLFLDPSRQLRNHRGDPRFKFLDKTILGRWGNAQVLRAIMQEAQSVWAIDSGPSHLAATTPTPTHVIWKKTNPSYCFDPCGNVVHYLPPDWETLYHPRWAEEAIAFFKEHYTFKIYGDDFLKVKG